MNVLLISGLGPAAAYGGSLDGTLLSPNPSPELKDDYRRLAGRPVDVTKLWFGGPSGYPVLRPRRGVMPHLTTETLRSIIESADVDFEIYALDDLWRETAEPQGKTFDVVGLSTTFICDRASLSLAIRWIVRRFPDAVLVLGGQFSNLKYAQILRDEPDVDYVIRGDAEHAFPKFLDALRGKGSFGDVPNIAARAADGSVEAPPITYIDLNETPSPSFQGAHAIIPYETMRGCPFTCKFCSFPAASPKWRFKSVEKICSDWVHYAEKNEAKRIMAWDSTFTIPPPRFKGLLEALPALGVAWDAFSRANVISSKEIVDALEASGCKALTIGYESMDDGNLQAMEKRVHAWQNVRAYELLADSNIDVQSSFIVGYPGETPEQFEKTHRFIVDRYAGHFMLHFFSLVDETMPVWDDAARFRLEVTNAYSWKHSGMDSVTAFKLRERTLDEARWKNDRAVNKHWQAPYERAMVPDRNLRQNERIEKLIEQLAFVRKDLGTDDAASRRCRTILDDLSGLGVELA